MNFHALQDNGGAGGRAIDCVLGEKYVRALWTPARHKAIYGGRGSAKSWSIATALSILAGQEKKKIVCARQFQNSIRDSSKALIEKRIEMMGIRRRRSTSRISTSITAVQKRFCIHLDSIGAIESIRSLEAPIVVWVEERPTVSRKSMECYFPRSALQDRISSGRGIQKVQMIQWITTSAAEALLRVRSSCSWTTPTIRFSIRQNSHTKWKC